MNCYKEVTVCLEYLLSKQQNTQTNTSLNLSSTFSSFSSNVVQEQLKVYELIIRRKAPWLNFIYTPETWLESSSFRNSWISVYPTTMNYFIAPCTVGWWIKSCMANWFLLEGRHWNISYNDHMVLNNFLGRKWRKFYGCSSNVKGITPPLLIFCLTWRKKRGMSNVEWTVTFVSICFHYSNVQME